MAMVRGSGHRALIASSFLKRGSLGSHGIRGNHDYRTVNHAWERVRNFRDGTALSTSSRPIVTGHGGLAPAEFDYDRNPREIFPLDQSRERRSMYPLKKYGLPAMCWRGMLRGRM